MRRKFFKITTAILLILTIVLIITTMKSFSEMQTTKVWAEALDRSYRQRSEDLDSRVKDFNANLEQLQEKYYEDKLGKLLPEDQLLALAKEQWTYSITANDTPFKEYQVYSSTRDVVIALAESQPSEQVLPSGIHSKGSLTSGDKSDSFHDHLMIEATVPHEKTVKTAENFTKVFYTFKGVPKGSIITINLSEPLRERLKLESSILEVIVNQ
jgi:hypothetical protein